MSDGIATEVFVPVPGFAGYRVSSLGRVQSCRTKGRRGALAETWRDVKLGQLRYGYLYVRFWQNSKMTRVYVHRLVLEAFVGPCPDGMECCHEDDDPANNRVSNLRWGTHQSNIRQASTRGRMARGRTNGLVKLTEGQVGEVRLLVAEGFRQNQIAAWFGICQQHVSNIVRGHRRAE